jgi:Integral membrane protein TerC family
VLPTRLVALHTAGGAATTRRIEGDAWCLMSTNTILDEPFLPGLLRARASSHILTTLWCPCLPLTQVEGVKRATPLLLVLLCVELSDLVFAVDSIPAVFGVTKDPFIVYTSNIFAILNLRSLYTVSAVMSQHVRFDCGVPDCIFSL